MCLRQLGFDVDINILLKSAKDSGFTKYGEMFSGKTIQWFNNENDKLINF